MKDGKPVHLLGEPRKRYLHPPDHQAGQPPPDGEEGGQGNGPCSGHGGHPPREETLVGVPPGQVEPQKGKPEDSDPTEDVDGEDEEEDLEGKPEPDIHGHHEIPGDGLVQDPGRNKGEGDAQDEEDEDQGQDAREGWRHEGVRYQTGEEIPVNAPHDQEDDTEEREEGSPVQVGAP